ncbi:MAG: aspartyl protease family protein [Methanosarcinales archaeon]
MTMHARFSYIDNDPLVLIKLINPISGDEIEVCAYVDSGSDAIVIPQDVWNNLNITSRRGTNVSVVGGVIPTWYTLLDVEFLGELYRNIIVFYQDMGDVLLGRNIIDNYEVTLNGLTSTHTFKK